MDEANAIENYLNLMVNADDQNRIAQGNDLVVYDLSKHYRKMLNKDGSFKNDTPYVSMIYEAATIMLTDEEDNSDTDEYVTVTIMQLGFSNLFGDFLTRPESTEIENSNSENVARMIVQTSYAVWQMNKQGYVHADLSEENVLVSGNPQNFSPLIIDFGRLINLTEYKAKALLLKEEMLNKSDPDYQRNLKYVDGSNYLITNQEAAFDFKYITIDPKSFLTSEWQEKLSRPHEMYLVNLKYNMGTMQLVTMFDLLLNTYIEDELINETHKNIQILKETIDSLIKMNREQNYVTSSELFQQFNKASGLNLTDFHSENVDLDNYFQQIGNSSDSEVPRKKKKIDNSNVKRLILV
jgi:serine/threonine protein kinase